MGCARQTKRFGRIPTSSTGLVVEEKEKVEVRPEASKSKDPFWGKDHGHFVSIIAGGPRQMRKHKFVGGEER